MESKSAESRYVPVIVIALFISAVLLVPLKIISLGYLPEDDALRHAAKAVSQKSWDEILVMRYKPILDTHPGWNSILTALHKWTGCSADALVTFSIVSLFVLFSVSPLLFMKRPESWLLALAIITVVNPILIMRLLLGRPYIVTMSALVIICFLWPRLKSKSASWTQVAVLTSSLSAAVWIHGLWQILALPILCFLLAKEWQAAFRLAVCIGIGIIVGACLTGHPGLLFKTRDVVGYMVRGMAEHKVPHMIASELRPFNGDVTVVFAVFGILMLGYIKRSWNINRIYNPVFILAALGWALGFVASRFWLDWGMPAIVVWIAQEVEMHLSRVMNFFSWRRAGFTLMIAAVLYLCVTSDYGGRWTHSLLTQYLSSDNPEQAEWLPEDGGIIYSDDMEVFYQTFYKNPHANCRYILGFEPDMMPNEDLKVLRQIQWSGTYEAFQPWVKKMRRQDRLILKGQSEIRPDIPALEWNTPSRGMWIGRLPRNQK